MTGPVEATALGNVLVQALALRRAGRPGRRAPSGGALGRAAALRAAHGPRRRRRDLPALLGDDRAASRHAPLGHRSRSDRREDDSRDRHPSAYQSLAARLDRRRPRRGRGGAGAGGVRGGDAVVGLRRLGHALRRVPPAGSPPRRVREDRRRRRGAPPDRHRARPWPCTSRGTPWTTWTSSPATWPQSGLRAGAVNPNLFQDPDYKLGSITNPDAGIRRKAVEHLLQCVQIAAELGSTAQSLWLADGTNYAGQDDLRARRDRLQDGLAELYAALPETQELLVEYKFFEPAFYATDIGDWGSALLLCQALGPRARVLVDLGHHAQGVNVEQIVADPGARGPARAAFTSTTASTPTTTSSSARSTRSSCSSSSPSSAPAVRAGGRDRLTIDQSHNIEAKVEAMVLSVVNLQESYVKSLLIDRAALAQAQGDADVLRGHELLLDAYNTDVRPLCAKVREELGAAADPIGTAARLGLRRAHRPAASQRGPGGRRGWGRNERRLPHRRHGGRSVVAGRCGPGDHHPGRGAARLPSAGRQPRAGQLRRRQHVGQGHRHRPRRARGPRRSGSRARAATWPRCRPRTSPRCGWTRSCPCSRATEMSDEDMVAHLARCQLDPAAPRSSIETLLHAFIPAAHVHHTHPDAINALACAADGQELIAECFGDSAAWIPYIRPGFTLAKQVGEAVRANPELRLVVLAKHGLVVWGDTARDAYEQTVSVCNQAAELVNGRSAQRAALRRPGAGRTSLDAEARSATLRRCCPRCAAPSPARAPRSCSPTSPPRCASWWTRARAAEIATVGAACPDHLVHTKRVPMWVAYDPARDEPRQRSAPGWPTAPPSTATSTRPTSRATPREDDVMADPDPRVVLIENVGHGHRRHDAQGGADLPRPVSPRDRGDGRRGRGVAVRLAHRGRELRRRVLAAGALQAVAGPAPGRAPGQGRAGHRRRRRYRPGRGPRARAAPGRRWWPSTSTATAPPTRWRSSATAGRRWAAT